jgi:transcriptional regulator with XRE-family HTH domain
MVAMKSADKFAEAFAAKLEALRKQRAVSDAQLAADLAALVEVSGATVRRWRKGKAKGGGLPRLDQAWALACYFGVSLDFLADESATGTGPKTTAEEYLLSRARKIGVDLTIARLVVFDLEADAISLAPGTAIRLPKHGEDVGDRKGPDPDDPAVKLDRRKRRK